MLSASCSRWIAAASFASRTLLRARAPGAIAAATAAAKQATRQRDQVRDALGRDLEAARYAVDRAFRQYDAADPANRLVAGELEARWNRSLARVAEVEGKIATHDAAAAPPVVDPSTLGLIASNLKTVWAAPTTDARLKKRIVRTLIHEVVADIDDEPSEIVLIVLVSEFSIAPLQSAYLGPFVFDGATRKPGDPGAPRNRIWLPTFAPGSKNRFGGLTAGLVKKIALLIKRNKRGKGAGKSVHYGFAELTTRGKKTYGLWKFPGRKSYTTSVPLVRAGKAMMRKGQQAMRKIKHWYDAGEPELMVESRLETHHTKRIDYGANMKAAQQQGIDRYPDYLDEELKKRGLA